MSKNKIPDVFFRLAVEEAFNHVILADADGKILYANAAAEKITGYSRQEILGKTPRLWGRQMDHAFYEKLWRTIKKQKKPFRGEITNRKKNGELYYAIGTISPILGPRKKLLGFLGVEEDITERKLYADRLEKEVEKRTAQLKKRMRELVRLKKEKDDFIASASHQLRTPVSVIKMQLELLKGEFKQFPEAVHLLEELDVLKENNKRTIAIMNDLFKVTELGEGHAPFHLKQVNLKGLIGQILETYRLDIRKLKLKIDVDIPAALQLKLDETWIRNALINLIDNAITYSNEKGVIRIRAVKENKKLVLSISDNGIGIPEEDQDSLFTKFFRAKNAYLKKTVGTGLGLIIAKIIIRRHKGSIRFESKEGEGTTFTITLPLGARA